MKKYKTLKSNNQIKKLRKSKKNNKLNDNKLKNKLFTKKNNKDYLKKKEKSKLKKKSKLRKGKNKININKKLYGGAFNNTNPIDYLHQKQEYRFLNYKVAEESKNRIIYINIPKINIELLKYFGSVYSFIETLSHDDSNTSPTFCLTKETVSSYWKDTGVDYNLLLTIFNPNEGELNAKHYKVTSFIIYTKEPTKDLKEDFFENMGGGMNPMIKTSNNNEYENGSYDIYNFDIVCSNKFYQFIYLSLMDTHLSRLVNMIDETYIHRENAESALKIRNLIDFFFSVVTSQGQNAAICLNAIDDAVFPYLKLEFKLYNSLGEVVNLDKETENEYKDYFFAYAIEFSEEQEDLANKSKLAELVAKMPKVKAILKEASAERATRRLFTSWRKKKGRPAGKVQRRGPLKK